MQIIQFVFSVIIALCAVAMFVCRSGNNAKSDKGCVGYVVGSYLPILLVSREIGLL